MELNPGDVNIIPGSPDIKQSASEALLGRIQSMRDWSWLSNIQSLCQEVGFTDVSSQVYPVPSGLQLYW